MKLNIEIGDRFERLVVIASAGIIDHRTSWLCQCDCGGTKVVSGTKLTGPKGRRVGSCGCWRNDHAVTHGLSRTRFYDLLMDMRKRCENHNHKNWDRYGGRGIYVCEEWRDDPVAFVRWCEQQNPDPDLKIERRDNNGPYAPWNCEFVTQQVQVRNRDCTKLVQWGREGVVFMSLWEKWSLIKLKTVVGRLNQQGYGTLGALFLPEWKRAGVLKEV